MSDRKARTRRRGSVACSAVIEQLESVEIIASRFDQQENRGEREQMRLRPRTKRKTAGAVLDAAVKNVSRRRGGDREGQENDQPMVRRCKERQAKDVKTDVIAEDGIAQAERHRVEEKKRVLPLAGALRAGDQPEQDAGREQQASDERIDQLGPRQLERVLEIEEAHAAQHARGKFDVGIEDEEEDRAADERQQ
jgi:galactokinase